MKQCPICRGRINDNACCVRCGAHLANLIHLEQSAKLLCWRALEALLADEVEQAHLLVSESMFLAPSSIGIVIKHFISALYGNDKTTTP